MRTWLHCVHCLLSGWLNNWHSIFPPTGQSKRKNDEALFSVETLKPFLTMKYSTACLNGSVLYRSMGKEKIGTQKDRLIWIHIDKLIDIPVQALNELSHKWEPAIKLLQLPECVQTKASCGPNVFWQAVENEYACLQWHRSPQLYNRPQF